MVGEGCEARRDYCPGGVQRDAAGWVLGALDAVEARDFAGHLLTCRACQLAVAELQPAARTLLATPSLRPPEHLKAATLARVRQAASRSRRPAR